LKDNYEKLKNEKFELEKKNAIYENQKWYNILLEILKFISSLVLWWIAWALFSKQYSRRLLIIGIPFGILYIACLVIPNLKTKIIKQ
jgi:TRAP-type C4-dicarboxylate transport system permease small subunit